MPELQWLLSQLWSFRTILDIAAVSAIVYWVLTVAQGTRASLLIRGALIFLIAAYVMASVLDLSTLNWILTKTWPALLIAIPVIFQPELRRALEQLGHTGSKLRGPLTSNGVEQQERLINEVVRGASQLARQRFGALMVIERETGLQDYVEKAIPIDGVLTRHLLINVFYPNSPLHDGAALIRGDRLVAAGAVLPLTDNISASSQLGTRHRAAIGVTEDSDALAIVVSEETGQIALAHSGRLIRDLDQDRLRRVLRTLMNLESGDTGGVRSNGRLRDWMRGKDKPAAPAKSTPSKDPSRVSASSGP